MERYICIHGHFYQPPRENPWLEAVELQDSAYPYHDWNERITAECYAPNGASRILDAEQRITHIVNNYSRISFNVGPTLLAWMETEAPTVYRSILAADRESRQRYSGHGSALAQAYNHMILPLANRRDKRTQVLWGVRDFVYRFGRVPEGMWLPETAVDLESLEFLAQAGVKFTILSPGQAARVRPIGARTWQDTSGGSIDPSMAYRIRLRSGRSLALFFYDGPISRAVAFENLLEKGENLAHRLLGAFDDSRPWPQLVHIATDGETYGHHRRHADMALAYALRYIETNGLARLTNYSEFLERHPPTYEVQIFENSSWSCSHGVERWKSNCGCNSGMHPGWNQEWRAPLREALDWLRDRLASHFEEKAGALFRDPWRAREDYIGVILDRSPENIAGFLRRHARRAATGPDRIAALQLLELQRQAMLMYTSCGWFFDELSGIETVQVIQYAARALQLAQKVCGDGLEAEFLARLSRARSNLPDHRDGRSIYEKLARTATVDLVKVAAHYAVSSLFEDYGDRTRIYSHTVERRHFRMMREGRIRLAVGRVQVSSRITSASQDVTFGVLHLGDQNVSGGVREFRSVEAYQSLLEEIGAIFNRGDIPGMIRWLDKHFGSGIYSLRLLFRDEQRKIVQLILERALSEAATLYRDFFERYSTLTRFVTDLAIPLPKRFEMAVDFTLNEGLLAELSSDSPDADRIRSVLEHVGHTAITLDTVTLEFAFRRTIERAARLWWEDPGDVGRLRRFERVVSVCALLPFDVDLWVAQNAYYETTDTWMPTERTAALNGDPEAQAWLSHALSLGELLKVRPAWYAEGAAQ